MVGDWPKKSGALSSGFRMQRIGARIPKENRDPENNVPDNCIGFRAGVCSLLRINVVKVRSDCAREIYTRRARTAYLSRHRSRGGGGYTNAPGQKSVTEISGFSAVGSPNCLRCYAFNLGNKETAGARWMNVTRSFVRPAPRFAAMSSGLRRKREKERWRGKKQVKERERDNETLKENRRKEETTSKDALSGTGLLLVLNWS